jgi:hypothetical protein
MSIMAEAAGTSVNGSFVAEVVWGAVVVVASTILLVVVLYVFGPRGNKARTGRTGRSPGGLVTGIDNRRSTSKTIAVAWTLVLAWMVVSVGFVAARTSGTTFSDLLSNASDLYLVFLGGPYAAAVLAKISTSANVDQGRLVKSTAQQPSLFDVVSDDNGNVDLYDFQYTLFNLIAIIIVIFTFVGHPGHGLPAIPDFLAVLTGGSALTYTVNKAVASSGPQILSVSPSTARIGDVLTISTSQLINQTTVSAAPIVTVGGLTATNVAITPGAPGTVTATIPSPPAGQTFPTGSPVQVAVTTANATVAALNSAVTIVEDKPTISPPNPNSIQANTLIKVFGQWLLEPGSADGTALAGATSVCGATVTLETDAGQACAVTFEGPYSNTLVTIRVGAVPGDSEQQAKLSLARGALTTPQASVTVTP